MAGAAVEGSASAPEFGDARAEFDAFMRGFEAACEAACVIEHSAQLAGQEILFRFAGKALEERLWPALAHLATESPGKPHLTVCSWDTASTEVEMPAEVGSVLTHLERAASTSEPRDGIFAAFVMPGLNLLDTNTSLAGFWVRDAGRLQYWEWAGPFRNVFHWWFAPRGIQLVHAAAVGLGDAGALIVGKSGSGKSTTAIGALLGGLSYTGDDRCLVTLEGVPRAHAVYATAKLQNENLDRFVSLRPLLMNPARDDDEKAVLLVSQHFPAQLVASLAIRAIVVPEVTGGTRTTFTPITPGAALRGLAPSTLLNLPAAGAPPLKFMGELVRRVPAWSMKLGSDPAEVTAALAAFLGTVPEASA
jgi:hypothetical protein